MTCNNTVVVEQKNNRLQDIQLKKIHNRKLFPILDILVSVKKGKPPHCGVQAGAHVYHVYAWDVRSVLEPMSTVDMLSISLSKKNHPPHFFLKLFIDNGSILSK